MIFPFMRAVGKAQNKTVLPLVKRNRAVLDILLARRIRKHGDTVIARYDIIGHHRVFAVYRTGNDISRQRISLSQREVRFIFLRSAAGGGAKQKKYNGNGRQIFHASHGFLILSESLFTS